jgi:N-ethylmaleimide reductase
MSSQSLGSLFTPVEIGQITLKHRIVMPAMSRLRAHWPSGDATNLMRDFYAQRASEGGLIIAEASAIAGEGRSSTASQLEQQSAHTQQV